MHANQTNQTNKLILKINRDDSGVKCFGVHVDFVKCFIRSSHEPFLNFMTFSQKSQFATDLPNKVWTYPLHFVGLHSSLTRGQTLASCKAGLTSLLLLAFFILISLKYISALQYSPKPFSQTRIGHSESWGGV